MVRAAGPEDMVEVVRYYLDHPAEADVIRRSGRNRALAEHTYEHRAKRLLAVARGEAGRGQIFKYKNQS